MKIDISNNRPVKIASATRRPGVSGVSGVTVRGALIYGNELAPRLRQLSGYCYREATAQDLKRLYWSVNAPEYDI
ncbi:hypothetical protein [Mesorhizobium sp. WSM4311]|uniref:hypothetical protein n=1 Tax=Mesorhizobium sp. WSM4311 TaxID=2029410 RepID=UPI0015C9B202|nr:hypothetical protein [Mesorhizobium sp. WSM4311]